MKVVVTGGAGFIGANLCRQLVATGVEEVVALDDLSTGLEANLEGVGATLVVGSILDAAVMADVVAGADSIVHLAARPSVPRSLADPMASHAVNATGTVTVLEAARAAEVPHVVVASSSSVYGANRTLPKHEGLATMPVSPYAVSKLATEAYALAWTRSFGLKVLPFRFFNVFGPLQPAGHAYAAVVPAFVDAALAGRPLPIHGDGSQTRDFTFVGTVAGVLAAAATQQVAHDGPVNLAFGTRTSLLELITVLEDVLGHPVERDHQPTRAGDVRDSQADDSLLRSLFPEARAVPLRDGLQATVDWFRAGA
ncbi:MAG TPA: NAD-dependent epimerase/dehydratase family protein [Iamia sp.]